MKLSKLNKNMPTCVVNMKEAAEAFANLFKGVSK